MLAVPNEGVGPGLSPGNLAIEIPGPCPRLNQRLSKVCGDESSRRRQITFKSENSEQQAQTTQSYISESYCAEAKNSPHQFDFTDSIVT